MVGEWQVIKCGLARRIIEYLHVVIDCLLVRQMEVILHMIRGVQMVACHILFFSIFCISLFCKGRSYIASGEWFRLLVRVVLLESGESMDVVSFWRNYQVFCWPNWFFISAANSRLLIFALLFLKYFFVCFQACEDRIWLPLCPREVILVPCFEVTHRPPEPLLEAGSDQLRVIAFADIVLIRGKRDNWEDSAHIVWSIYFH